MNEDLLENLADWMIAHGTVISDRQRHNYYTGVRIVNVVWQNQKFTIVQVDGMTCRIDRK